MTVIALDWLCEEPELDTRTRWTSAERGMKEPGHGSITDSWAGPIEPMLGAEHEDSELESPRWLGSRVTQFSMLRPSRSPRFTLRGGHSE